MFGITGLQVTKILEWYLNISGVTKSDLYTFTMHSVYLWTWFNLHFYIFVSSGNSSDSFKRHPAVRLYFPHSSRKQDNPKSFHILPSVVSTIPTFKVVWGDKSLHGSKLVLSWPSPPQLVPTATQTQTTKLLQGASRCLEIPIPIVTWGIFREKTSV